MRPSQNPPLPPRMYPSVQHLDATPPPTQSTLRPRINPFFNNYVRPSQNLPLPPEIYPFFNNYVQPSQNLTLPPRIYPLPF